MFPADIMINAMSGLDLGNVVTSGKYLRQIKQM